MSPDWTPGPVAIGLAAAFVLAALTIILLLLIVSAAEYGRERRKRERGEDKRAGSPRIEER